MGSSQMSSFRRKISPNILNSIIPYCGERNTYNDYDNQWKHDVHLGANTIVVSMSQYSYGSHSIEKRTIKYELEDNIF